MTSSADERGTPTGRPGDTSGKPGSATPSTAPAKPGSTGSSALASSATPKAAEAPKPTEPAKPGTAGGPAVASSAKPAEATPPTTSSKSGNVEPAKPAATSAETAKPGQTGTGSSAPNANPAAAASGATGGKDASAKPGGSGPQTVWSTSAGKGGPTSASSAATPKSGSADPVTSSSVSPAQPVKSAATGSSAVPPVSPTPSSSAAKPEAPAKAGTTGSSAIGPDAEKDRAKTASATGSSAGATRVKPEDALTDGPILDLKANRGADPAPAKDKDGTKPAASTAPEIAAARSGPGFGALAASGLVGGLVGALLLFLLAQSGLLAPKGESARLDALDKRIAALAPGDAVAALDKRVTANEAALKPLPEAITKAQSAASSATEKADQALRKAAGSPAAPAAEGATPAPVAPTDLVARLDALDQRVSALQEEPAREQGSEAKLGAAQSGEETVRLADLDVRLKALETKGQTQGAPAVPEEDLAPKLAALQGDLESRTKANEAADKALGQRLDQLQQSLDGRVTAATEAVQQVTQASRQTAEASKTQAEEAAKAVDRRLQEQAERIAALDKSVDAGAKAATVQATLRVVAANRISDALVSGAPYADAFGSLRGSDAGDGAALEPLATFADSGAPTASGLADEFRPIAEKIAAARRSARAASLAASGSIGDRLMSMAESVVQVKRVAPGGAPVGGSSSAAPAADDEPEVKVQDALDHGRIGDAAKAFAALPEDVRAQAKDFGVRLKSVADARAAAQSLQADAFKALSAPAAGR